MSESEGLESPTNGSKPRNMNLRGDEERVFFIQKVRRAFWRGFATRFHKAENLFVELVFISEARG